MENSTYVHNSGVSTSKMVTQSDMTMMLALKHSFYLAAKIGI